MREEELIESFDVKYYKHVLGAGKVIGGASGGVVMAAFVVPNEGRSKRVSEMLSASICFD